MEKLKQFFAIYRNKDKKFIHDIFEGKNKKLIKEQLRAEGYIVKGVFSQKDITNVLNYEFTDANVSDATIEYLKEHLSYWNENKKIVEDA